MNLNEVISNNRGVFRKYGYSSQGVTQTASNSSSETEKPDEEPKKKKTGFLDGLKGYAETFLYGGLGGVAGKVSQEKNVQKSTENKFGELLGKYKWVLIGGAGVLVFILLQNLGIIFKKNKK